MKKLKLYIEKWMDGQKVRGINPSFINGNVKEIFDKCNIKTVTEGIGWRVA